MDATAQVIEQTEEKVKRGHTVADVMALPETKRVQLIDGVLYDMAPPMRQHQRILMGLSVALYDHIKKKGGGCEVYPAPFGVFLPGDEKNYFEPDITVVCDPEKLSDRGCEGAPDLIIEIASPGTQKMDYMMKFGKYQEIGVREYWIVNPMQKNVSVYWFEGVRGKTAEELLNEEPDPEEKLIYSFDEEIPFHLYPDLKVKIAAYL